MSNPNNRLCADLRWKTFVKESDYTDNSKSKEHNTKTVSLLAFKGLEAKIAYEHVLSQDTREHLTQSSAATKLINGNKNQNQVKSRKQTGKAIVDKCRLTESAAVNSILKAVEQQNWEFLRNHLHYGNVNVCDQFGWTPLMSAAYCGYLDIVEFLLNLGANRKARDKAGLTATQLALKKNCSSIVDLLEKKHQAENKRKRITYSNKVRKESFPEQSVAVENEQSLETGFYCEICKSNFKETTKKNHESSILHIFNAKPKLPNPHYVIPKQCKGYQMLLNSGWDEKDGLGPNGKGSKYPVKTVLKSDRKGLGQAAKSIARVTHFQSGDCSAVNSHRVTTQKKLRKRDREKQLNRETRKEKAFRIALS